jgi:hypothetical protein
MARRKPGAGRKPQGEFKGKSATITTRITPELRSGLEREAKRSGRSLSQEIEWRLRHSLTDQKTVEEPRNQGLAELVAKVAGKLELQTGESWRADRFTAIALRDSMEILINGLTPTGEVKVPAKVEELISRIPALRDQYEKPAGIATGTAFGILEGLRIAEYPPPGHPDHHYYSDEFFWLPRVREKLGL